MRLALIWGALFPVGMPLLHEFFHDQRGIAASEGE